MLSFLSALGRPRRRITPALALTTAVMFGVVSGAAMAAPLNETEPNEDVLTANGPIPPDGWVFTRNTTNDEDVAYIHLAGRQQVTFSVQALSSCGGAGVSVVDEDGSQVFKDSTGTSPSTRTYTTPRDAARYTVRSGSFVTGAGCSGLFKVMPSTAVINGPLPPLDYGRSLSVTAPAEVDEGQTVTTSVSGTAAYRDQLAVEIRSGCGSGPTSPSSSSSSSQSALGVELPGGAFAQTRSATAPGDGPAVACAWLVDALKKLPNIVGQQPIMVRTPPASIKLKAAARTRLGSTFKVTATATGGSGRYAIVDLNKPGVACGATAVTNPKFARVFAERLDEATTGSVASDKATSGVYTLCGYVQESESDPEPAEAAATRAVSIGIAVPACRISTASVRRGRLLTIRCTGIPASDRVNVAAKRRGKPVRVRSALVRNGTVTVRAPGRRGTYVVTVSHRGKVLASRSVRVR